MKKIKISISFLAMLMFGFSSMVNGQELTEQEEVFKVVEEMPRFPGCEEEGFTEEEIESCAKEKMLTFIYSNLKYPEEARKQEVEGICVVQFIINKDGSIRDLEIVRDIGAGCGEEAARVISAMNDMDEKWTPGKQRGKAVNVIYILPIKYRLS